MYKKLKIFHIFATKKLFASHLIAKKFFCLIDENKKFYAKMKKIFHLFDEKIKISR